MNNTFQLLQNYFGFIHNFNSEINILIIVFISLFLTLIFKVFDKKNKHYLSAPILLLSFFCLFVVFSYITKNSFFYARTSITFVVVSYVLLADLFSNGNKISRYGVFIIILLQFSQFFIYFSKSELVLKNHEEFNYRHNPVAHFKNYNFGKKACLIPIPGWNYAINKFFLGNNVKVIPIYARDYKILYNEVRGCEKIYVLDQTSVGRDRIEVKENYQSILGIGSDLLELKTYENQKLYQIGTLKHDVL